MSDDPQDLVDWMFYDSNLGEVRTIQRPAETPPTSNAPHAPELQAVPVAPIDAPPARRTRPWHRLALGAVLLLAAALNLWNLWGQGYPNQYYAAAVLSMLQSWRNFFFVSFDPGGFVSVDKPPLGFMIQTAFAEVLGFSGFSILLPEALAGIASVAVLYLLVRRAFGPTIGVLAALALALTPVSVVVSRNNTIDSLLVLTVLLAAWAAFVAAERGSLRWLLVAVAVVGLGFAIKMLQAYLVVPAIFLLYLAVAPRPRFTRIGHLALAALVLVAVSFAWPVAVDLTPAADRPWVDSTQDNSAVSLAIGYNGIQRLLGRGGSLTGALDAAQNGRSPINNSGFGGPGGLSENGTPGPLRLINQQLGGQASWLLPLALLGLAASAVLAWRHRGTLHRSRRAQALFLWGGWAVTAGAFFSVAGYFHSYYLVMLGPPFAALAAIGLWAAWRAYRARRWLAWSLPLALLATAALQAYMLAGYQAFAAWLVPVALGGAAVAAVALLALRLGARALPSRSRLAGGAHLAAGFGCLALLVAPAVWSGYSSFSGTGGGGIPSAGPRGAFGRGFGGPGAFQPQGGGFPDFTIAPPGFGGGQAGSNGRGAGAFDGRGRAGGGQFGGGPGGFGGPGGEASSGLLTYLERNQGSATYLVATTNSNSAAPIILATGKPVMSLGGFLGSDPILTTDQLAQKVANGEVRFFLLGGGPGGFGGRDGEGASAWVQANCATVPADAISGAAGQTAGGFGRAGSLYDCAGAIGTSA